MTKKEYQEICYGFTVTYNAESPGSGICQMRICELYVDDPSNKYILKLRFNKIIIFSKAKLTI